MVTADSVVSAKRFVVAELLRWECTAVEVLKSLLHLFTSVMLCVLVWRFASWRCASPARAGTTKRSYFRCPKILCHPCRWKFTLENIFLEPSAHRKTPSVGKTIKNN